MDKRLKLQKTLEDILGSQNVYFQRPSSYKMHYPCIKYNLEALDILSADNTSYHKNKRYALTYIDQNPDSKIPDILADLPKCSFDRFYTAENLNHWVFSIYI